MYTESFSCEASALPKKKKKKMKYSFSVRVNIREVERGTWTPACVLNLFIFLSRIYFILAWSTLKKKKKKVNELFKWYLKKIRSLIAERERVIGHEGTRRGVTVWCSLAGSGLLSKMARFMRVAEAVRWSGNSILDFYNWVNKNNVLKTIVSLLPWLNESVN